jgi:hypothetical protein
MSTATCSEVSIGTLHPALELLLELEDAGLSLTVDAAGLRSRPKGRITPEQAARVKRWRSELIQLIQCCEPAVVARRRAFAAQWMATSGTQIPAFVYRPDAHDTVTPGRCYSCGDANGQTSAASCGPCALACRAVVGLVPGLEAYPEPHRSE